MKVGLFINTQFPEGYNVGERVPDEEIFSRMRANYPHKTEKEVRAQEPKPQRERAERARIAHRRGQLQRSLVDLFRHEMQAHVQYGSAAISPTAPKPASVRAFSNDGIHMFRP